MKIIVYTDYLYNLILHYPKRNFRFILSYNLESYYISYTKCVNLHQLQIHTICSAIAHFLLNLSLSPAFIILEWHFDSTTCSSDSIWQLENVFTFPLDCHRCHLNKRVFYCYIFLGRGLVVGHATILLAPCLCVSGLHFTLRLLVYLITNQHKWEFIRISRCGMLNKSISPSSQVFEALLICDIVDQCTTVSTPVEGIPKWLEFFLSSGIPYLQSHNLVINGNFLLGKISTNGWLGMGIHFLIYILLEEGCLSYTTVAQNNYFQKVFLLATLHFYCSNK